MLIQMKKGLEEDGEDEDKGYETGDDEDTEEKFNYIMKTKYLFF